MPLLLLLVLAAALAAPASASAGKFTVIRHPTFRFVRQGFGVLASANLRAMQRIYKPVPMLDIALRDAPNRASQINAGFGPVGGAADGFDNGFQWDYADETLRQGKPWFPQGITGTADANPAANLGGHKIIVVGWYQRRTLSDDTSVSSRITIVNSDSLAAATYRHVLLVQMTGGAKFTTTPNHAGGVAWVGNDLYVADTSYGLRVYDIRHILRVPKKRRNLSATYKYILPQVGEYRIAGVNPPHISSVSVDRTSAPVSLLTSEYVNGAPNGRHGVMGRWNFAGATGPLRGGNAVAAYREPDTNVQGATSVRGVLVNASSAGAGSNGRLTYGRPGRRATTRPWAIGGESLSYAAGTNRLYTVTEQPSLRALFGFDAGRLGL